MQEKAIPCRFINHFFMKAAFITLMVLISVHSFTQSMNRAGGKNVVSKPAGTNAGLNGNETGKGNESTRRSAVQRGANNIADTVNSPSLGDSISPSNGSSTSGVPERLGNTSVRGGNDTTFNVHTISGPGITTNLGAVDRSGQAQFGQSNWGNSRGTVGESQWTVPPPITPSFNKDFPAVSTDNWSRNNIDTSVYSPRSKSGARWVTTSYNNAGQRVNRRMEFPLLQAPRNVLIYAAKQPPNFQIARIYKLQIEGKADVYEVETTSGKKIYINNEGMEVNY